MGTASNAFSHLRQPFIPMAMPEELPAPFPMSPSALPGDACDSLLNDSEQKYFSEFLDTFWGPEDTLSAPLEAAALYPEQRTSQGGHDQYGQVAGSGAHHDSVGNQYGGGSSSTEWSQQRGSEGHYEPPPQHRPGFGHEQRTFQIAEQHHENAHPSWHEEHAVAAAAALPLAPAPVPHHPPPQLYIQTSRSLAPVNQQQSSGNSASLPSANHGQPTPQTAMSSRNPLTDDTPASDEQDDSRSVSPTDTPTDESHGAAQSARRGSASTKGSATKPRTKNMKRRNGRELLTEQEKRTNHIVSEQKRRTLIRSGFKALADLVPGANSSGNLGSSKSVILHNAVGFIRHLEYGNRALAEQLERLHKRYEMKMAAAGVRGSGSVPMPQPPPSLPPASSASSPHPTATAHYTHHTHPPQQQLQSQPPIQNPVPATRPRSVSAIPAAAVDQFPHYPPDNLPHQQNQHHHRPLLDQQPPRTSPQLEPRQTPRRLSSPSRA
ncbi:hypothetical protein HDU87_002832 [Geranomyces variabilis]|uniref:BHLH domain-containing protein n=1 Tax=Geranomyces variabilis TaxID=109894 RepID=A0AAD5XRX5_9FUNG|nr:hypothetical protein HDU87_002832 [Geranomyces variabilis]